MFRGAGSRGRPPGERLPARSGIDSRGSVVEGRGNGFQYGQPKRRMGMVTSTGVFMYNVGALFPRFGKVVASSGPHEAGTPAGGGDWNPPRVTLTSWFCVGLVVTRPPGAGIASSIGTL